MDTGVGARLRGHDASRAAIGTFAWWYDLPVKATGADEVG